MRISSDAKENRTTELAVLTPRVVGVSAHPDFKLSVEFADGLKGAVDCSAMIHGARAGVFETLRDPAVFTLAFVSHGAVAWPGDIDLAPDAMHAAVKSSGLWRLE